jgi:sterol desaturase/sphingolipid hydroxylase (fatty acid hydroxylase superfamily)
MTVALDHPEASRSRLRLILDGLDYGLTTLCFGRERRITPDKIKSFATTLGWLVVNSVAAPIVYVAMTWTRELYALLHVPVLPASLWTGMPWPMLFLISVLTKDFADYCNHRWMHTRWGWPIHAVHHSDTDVNILTTWRVHFLEAVVMDASYVLLLSWMGLPPAYGAVARFFFTLHNAYTHMDADIEHGPFRYLLASPRFHRWHHADIPEAHGKNLANIFPFLDVIFGTYYVPGRCNAPMGALTDHVPAHDIVSQIALPFTRWAKLSKRALSPLLRPTFQTKTAAAGAAVGSRPGGSEIGAVERTRTSTGCPTSTSS